MKKILLTFIVMFAISASMSAQIISDNFDSYGADTLVAEQSGGLWTTWSGMPGSAEDAYVSDSMSFSGANSLLLEQATTDLVLPFGNLTTGSYEFGAKMYFPAGHGGYFNLMHTFDGGAYEWAIDIFFNGDGTGSTTAAGVADVAFSYPEDMWIDVKAKVDLDNDLAQMYVAGVLVREWQWSLVNNTGAAGTNQLAVADFYPAAVSGAMYFVDDVYFMEAAPLDCFVDNAIFCDDFDSYVADSLVGLQGGGLWTTWSSDPGSTEDAYVSSAQSFSQDNSVELITGLGTDLVFPLGGYTSGEYEWGMKMYVPDGSSAYFNTLHVFDGNNSEFALEVLFNADGSGVLNAGGAASASFSYPHDAWFDAVIYADMDLDIAKIFVNGVLVHTWQWSLQSGGTAGTNALGAMDIYPGVEPTDHFYIDNVYLRLSDVIEADVDCFAPTAMICDGFENYITTQKIAGQSNGVWTTWSDAPGSDEDTYATTDMAFEGNKSAEFIAGQGTDFVLPFGDLTSGEYMLSMKVNVPTDASGYFNVMHTFIPSSQTYEWGLDVFFNADGTGAINAAGNDAATFTYNQNEWVDVQLNIDLDWNWAILTIGGTEVHAWEWGVQAGGDPGANTLAVMDIYPGVEATDHFFVDNVSFDTAANIDFSSVSEIQKVEFTAYPNPSNGEFTLVNGATGNYTLQMIDVLGRIVYSETLSLTQGQLAKIETGVITEGVYTLKMTNESNNQSNSIQMVIE